MKRGLALAALCLGFAAMASDAWAVVGMPLTPVSYAGVARRTTRRVVATETVAAAAATPAVATIPALPPGCVETNRGGVIYQQCGTTFYRPYYQGPNLVYVVATP